MKTPFHEIHKAQAAELTEYQGWELPDHFTDPEEEYRSVRNTVGLIDVSYRTTIRVGGPERVEFLHRIVSNDIRKLATGAGCQAVFLTAKGKIISAMNVLVAADEILLETEPVARQPLLDKLDMYRLAQKVTLEDATEAVAKVLVHGPKSTELLQAVVGQEVALAIELQHQECQIAAWGPGGRGEGEPGEHEDFGFPLSNPPSAIRPRPSPGLRVVRTHETGEVGYELIMPATRGGDVWNLMCRAGADFGLRPVGFQAFNTLRVEAGIPWYGVDIDDTNFPQEVGLDHTLDWDKGCYLGYEPVARIKFRGHINRKLAGLKFTKDARPEPGGRIVKEGREIGHVTSPVFSPRLNAPIALGQVRRECLESGTEVTVETADGPTTAVIAELPFYHRAAG